LFTPADEERLNLMKSIHELTKTANIVHLTTEETQITKDVTFWPTLQTE